MPELTRVFVSYAWRDGATVAEWLYRRLNALDGWSAWMDLELHADTLFSHELQRRIDDADLIVVVVSPDVNRRDTPSFVLKELQYATDPHVNKPVFAVRAADCQLPLIIQGWTYTDFLDTAQYETAFAALLAKITSGKQPPRPQTRRERELDYLRSVAREHGFWGKVYVEVAAETRLKPTPDADKIVVVDPEVAAFLGEVAMAVYAEKGHQADDDPDALRVESFAALGDALARFERVAIIGDPGTGKTTTLRRLAYDLGEQAALDEGAPLPLYVPLGGYDGGDFPRYLDGFFGGLRLRDYLPGRVVLLLDGLNEMPHAHVGPVQAWLAANLAARVLLTCRKLDYLERRLEMQRVDVLPLDAPRIRLFMQAYKLSDAACDRLFWGLARSADLESLWGKWQQAGLTFEAFWRAEQPLDSGHPVYTKTTSDEDRAYNAMRAALRKRDSYPGLLGLARNPFLLTLTISLYHQTGAVPRNRAQLFDGFVRGLMAERGKVAATRQGVAWLDEAVQRRALARLAYRMQAERTGTRVDETWARAAVAEIAPEAEAAHLLYLAASAGIIEKGAQVRFVHQLLQEYFAAYEMGEDLRRGVAAARYFPGDRWWEVTGWEETALLLAEMGDGPEAVVRWLTPVQPTLAYRCATESSVTCGEDALTPLLYPPDGARRCPIACAEGGRRLAALGDNRPGVGLRPDGLPDIEWVKIPAGEFQMGGDPDAGNAWAGGAFDIPYTFWMAKYPVTVAQYAAFVADDGYLQREYWTDAGWQWRGEKTQPDDYWNDPKWHIGNHPVVGVRWYEAYAYTRWLTVRYRELGLFNGFSNLTPALSKGEGDSPSPMEKGLGDEVGWQIRLPTEAEWEKAARYPDGRKYPWGDDYVSGYANINETHQNQNVGPYYLQRTTAVGLYPQGASERGIYDLAGNVWEWCLTAWADEYQHPGTNDPEGDGRRVLRGGSWDNPQLNARAASRFSNYPGNWDDFRGFRVVVGCP